MAEQNPNKRKNHKKVEIANVVILASDFRFFHTVHPLVEEMLYLSEGKDLVLG